MTAVECADAALRKIEAANLANGLHEFRYTDIDRYAVRDREDPRLEQWGAGFARRLHIPEGALFGFPDARGLHRALAAYVIGECYRPPSGRRVAWREGGRKTVVTNYPEKQALVSQVVTGGMRNVVPTDDMQLWSDDGFGWQRVLGVALAYAREAGVEHGIAEPANGGNGIEEMVVRLAERGLPRRSRALDIGGNPSALAYVHEGELCIYRVPRPSRVLPAEEEPLPLLRFSQRDAAPLVRAAVACYARDTAPIGAMVELFRAR